MAHLNGIHSKQGMLQSDVQFIYIHKPVQCGSTDQLHMPVDALHNHPTRLHNPDYALHNHPARLHNSVDALYNHVGRFHNPTGALHNSSSLT